MCPAPVCSSTGVGNPEGRAAVPKTPIDMSVWPWMANDSGMNERCFPQIFSFIDDPLGSAEGQWCRSGGATAGCSQWDKLLVCVERLQVCLRKEGRLK